MFTKPSYFSARLGLVFLLVGAAHQAQSQPFAYVGNTRSDTITGYSVDSNGVFTLLPWDSVSVGPFPISLAVHPNGQFLYVANLDWRDRGQDFGGNGNVSAYFIDPDSGQLTPNGDPLPAAYAWQVVLDPSGRFAYVPNGSGDEILGFTIDSDSGALTPMDPPSFPAGSFPRSAIVDPTGQYLYAANAFSNDVSIYSIDPSSGTLTEIGDPVDAGAEPRWVTIDPTGQFLYVANQASLDISAYQVNGDGTLSPVPGMPFDAVDSGNGGAELDGLTIDPTGQYLYGAVWSPSDPVQVPAFQIGGDGSLSPVPGSPFSAGVGAIFAAVDPTGQFVYVANELSYDVTAYRINLDTGELLQMDGSFPAGRNPECVAVAIGGASKAVRK